MCKYIISEVDYEWKCPHQALRGSDFCIFHLEDDSKDKKQFSDSLNKVLKNSEKEIHLDGFYFPAETSEFKERKFEKSIFLVDAKIAGKADFSHALFKEHANFKGAIFKQEASFEGAEFNKGAGFAEATFTAKAIFILTNFLKECGFTEAIFIEEASFEGATFTERASFEGATFTERASFEGATFTKGANFTWTNFANWSNFIGAAFNGKANFIWTTFTGRANFIWTTFLEDVNFNEAAFLKESNFIWTVFMNAAFFEGTKFNGDANFHEATFNETAEFNGAGFAEEANFQESIFNKKANFEKTTFNKKANFEKTTFNKKALFSAVAINGELNFKNVTLEKPGLITFRNGADLRGALFEGTDLRKIDFVDVKWDYTGGINTRALLKEETYPKKKEPLNEKKELEKLEKMYREIRQNYEAKRNYKEAGHFFVSEMEMRRKQKDPVGRVISITALHKYLSFYGENYWIPLLWLILMISVSTVLYEILGLLDSGKLVTLKLSQYIIYSIQAATFQNPDYFAQYTILGELVLTLETVLGPFFLLLCALALMKRFRR